MIVTLASLKGGVGKTTSAVHIAAHLQQKAPTLLVDCDSNRSALQWAENGLLPFKVASDTQALKLAKQFEHMVIDTAARPTPEELRALADGCDLMVVPTNPGALALGVLFPLVKGLAKLETPFKVLLTLVPPAPSKAGEEAIELIKGEGLPLFQTSIRRLAVYEKAALQGVVVKDVKDDQYSGIAWRQYQELGKEILS